MEAWATERFNGFGQVLNYRTVSLEWFPLPPPAGGAGQFNIFTGSMRPGCLIECTSIGPHQISYGLIILPAVTRYISLKGRVCSKLKFPQFITDVDGGSGDSCGVSRREGSAPNGRQGAATEINNGWKNITCLRTDHAASLRCPPYSECFG